MFHVVAGALPVSTVVVPTWLCALSVGKNCSLTLSTLRAATSTFCRAAAMSARSSSVGATRHVESAAFSRPSMFRSFATPICSGMPTASPSASRA